MYYHFLIHNDPDGLWAECIELSGCVTQSENNTMKDLHENMGEALNLYLDEQNDDILFPLPHENIEGEMIVKVKVNPDIAQKIYLNHDTKRNRKIGLK